MRNAGERAGAEESGASASGVERPRTILFAALVALTLCLGNFLAFGDVFLNLRDEGYLWYGVEAVRRGDVPLLDFQAYDPGRYYWSSWLAPLFGRGIVGIRGAVALFQALGMTLGLLALRRVVTRDAWLIPMGVALLLWGFPRFKLFESSITLAAVWAMTRLIERPSAGRHFVLGVVVGLSAFFGRNHGVYLVAASALVFGFLAWRRSAERPLACLVRWGLGIVVGYAPMLAMLALTPGYPAAFREAIVSILERGANVPKDFPWAWGPALDEHGVAGGLALQVAFYLPVVLLPLGALAVLRTRASDARASALLVACCAVGVVYVHHYALRSDLPHLAQAAQPLVLLGVALAARFAPRARPAAIAVLLAQAGFLAAYHHPVLREFGPAAEKTERAPFVVYEGAPEREFTLMLPAGLSRHLERVRRMIDTALPPDAPMFIAPTRPTFYPLFDKASPTWWIYYLWPMTEVEQHETIDLLAERDVDWAFIVEKSFVDDEGFDFQNTNPLVWRHLTTDWELLQGAIVPQDYYLFRRRSTLPR